MGTAVVVPCESRSHAGGAIGASTVITVSAAECGVDALHAGNERGRLGGVERLAALRVHLVAERDELGARVCEVAGGDSTFDHRCRAREALARPDTRDPSRELAQL